MAGIRLMLVGVGLWALGFGWLSAQSAGPIESTFFDAAAHPAIGYMARPSEDPVARLEAALEAGSARLEFDARSGYLPSLLRALEISTDSQLAVFSKTSLQSDIIGPRNPRSLFFNDRVVAAWPRGGFIELAAQDARQGVTFYTLDQHQSPTPRFVRPDKCLGCHVTYATLNVPGMLLRSVATAGDGRVLPYLANGIADHRTPFEERWAGWFVTGTTGALRHLGNAAIAEPGRPDAASPAATPLTSLGSRLDTGGYLSTHSDIAALLVFTHQMHMMNLLTRIGWQTRVMLADHDATAAETLTAAAVEFVDYLLFVDEPPLPEPVHGASGFAERFSALGPRDRAGRSLRELDLRTRMLKYPCSYLIYSPAFDALPAEAKRAIYARMWQVLSGAGTGARYRTLTPAVRQAIVEILRDTKTDLPAYFLPPRR